MGCRRLATGWLSGTGFISQRFSGSRRGLTSRYGWWTMLESELFAFLESTADAAFSITETGEILSWNAAAEALFGFKASDVLQKHCYEVLDARGRLGTSICMRDCAVQRCALHAGPVPSFDMQARHGS